MSSCIPLMPCRFETIDALYQSYMSFLQGGGLFVKVKEDYFLGDLLVLDITLMDDPTNYRLSGKVAWVTPQGAQGHQPAGIGVQFIEDTSSDFCNKIEAILGDLL